MKSDRVFISCGGTGGHFFPGLSIARELKNRNSEVKLLLSGVNSVKQSADAAKQGIASAVLPRMPSPGKNPLRLIRFAWGLAGGFFQMLRLFGRERPDYLLIMGSFASAPAYLAAFFRRVPVILHDGNARIGKANRFMSRRARFMGTAFPAVNDSSCRCRVLCTGMPVRPELEEKCRITKAEAVAGLNAEFGLEFSDKVFTFLIFGGSQGAATFNRNLPEALASAGRSDFQVLHLTGKGKLEETLKLYEKCTFPRLVIESSPRMELFLGCADTVFCRSGGSSVAELALFGKSAVLIPYPYAAEKHQNDNAGFYVSSGAAELIEDREFTVERARETLLKLLNDPELNARRSAAALSAARPGAAAVLLEHIAAL